MIFQVWPIFNGFITLTSHSIPIAVDSIYTSFVLLKLLKFNG